MSSPISPACARPEPALSRREVMAAGAAGLALAALPSSVQAAAPPALAELIARVTEGAVPERSKITFDIPQLVENGNSVDVAILVESPMTEADHVRWIHVIAEKNPFPDVARFNLTPRSGRADIRATLRLATSQKVAVVAALSGGSYVMADADIVVTLSACIDGG
ncbi:thiosulfate oxidation carrier protein SoxY [Bosea sp. (in: a-proteobacteria)]|uniref:thiosulfate oxidation carrier protein SoxY n=1 Tax=Bosea sp. (in: a-proteobacteria) TaxID=1871050 RepID=UPI002DDCDE15|nr:thiosulfate oxidation carrier protein SoxY [Bosea sp. (in: a-proteobacteria)]HEV2510651.1 thiosulfate oxidation carrier protein SoxY [Bosea sp. (in: a-proteobacteria)]